MKHCASCGNLCEDNAKFCEICGSSLAESAPKTSDEQNAKTNASQKAQNAVDDVINSFKNTADTTADYLADDVDKNRFMALLSYLGILFLIPLICRKDSPYVRFHVNQGIVLFIAEIIANLFWKIPYVGGIISSVLSVLLTVICILGIINAATGKAKELPLIGKIRILK